MISRIDLLSATTGWSRTKIDFKNPSDHLFLLIPLHQTDSWKHLLPADWAPQAGFMALKLSATCMRWLYDYLGAREACTYNLWKQKSVHIYIYYIYYRSQHPGTQENILTICELANLRGHDKQSSIKSRLKSNFQVAVGLVASHSIYVIWDVYIQYLGWSRGW